MSEEGITKKRQLKINFFNAWLVVFPVISPEFSWVNRLFFNFVRSYCPLQHSIRETQADLLTNALKMTQVVFGFPIR